MSEQLYRRVELTDDALVQFVGCYVLKWPYDMLGEPEVGFVEVEDDDQEGGSNEGG